MVTQRAKHRLAAFKRAVYKCQWKLTNALGPALLRRLGYLRWAGLEALEQRVLLSGAPPTIVFSDTPYVINEGQALVLNASTSTDPESDPLTFQWDLNNDSTFGDVTGANPTVTWSTLNTFGIDDNGTFTIGLELDDGTNTVTDTVSLTVNNTAPTIALSGSGSVDENSAYTLTLGTVTDPGDDTATLYSGLGRWIESISVLQPGRCDTYVCQ